MVGVDVKSASNARTISHSLARYLEKVGLIQRDIALGPQQGQKGTGAATRAEGVYFANVTCKHRGRIRSVGGIVVKLPMAGSVSSLNVSVATGVCLYEMVRQRDLA